MFTEQEAMYIFNFLLETMYQCWKRGVYHGNLRAENIILICRENFKNINNDEIDPQTFKFDSFFNVTDEIDFKIKGFLYHKYIPGFIRFLL